MSQKRTKPPPVIELAGKPFGPCSPTRNTLVGESGEMP